MTFEYINSRLLSRLPQDQIERVTNSDMCDIDADFLGFVHIYYHLSKVIPSHFTVLDLGCAYAPQAFYFERHKKYVGVDMLVDERFAAANTEHHLMSIADFVVNHDLHVETTFAICSYVPPWRNDNVKIVRDAFPNLFTFYPCREQNGTEARILK